MKRLSALKEFATLMMSGKDNSTPDFMKWCAFAAFNVGLGLSIYSVVIQDAPFDLMDFGMGTGVLLLSLGGGLKLKETTEPASNENIH